MREKWRSGRGEGKERSVMRGEGRCWRGEEDGRSGWRGEMWRDKRCGIMYLKMKGSFGRKVKEGRALASVFTVYSSGYRHWCWRRRMLMEHGLVVHSKWCLEWGGEEGFSWKVSYLIHAPSDCCSGYPVVSLAS